MKVLLSLVDDVVCGLVACGLWLAATGTCSAGACHADVCHNSQALVAKLSVTACCGLLLVVCCLLNLPLVAHLTDESKSMDSDSFLMTWCLRFQPDTLFGDLIGRDDAEFCWEGCNC